MDLIKHKISSLAYARKVCGALFGIALIVAVCVLVTHGIAQIIFALLTAAAVFIGRLFYFSFCRCPSCGMPVVLIRQSCPDCGADLSGEANTDKRPPEPKINVALYAAIETVLFIAVIAITCRYLRFSAGILAAFYLILSDKLFFRLFVKKKVQN